ncbi:hypothetical protein [Kaistia sp. MMO-174]|uniref:hypothetical protein n=1 Tax=Kaistia sp. MMO-174 TaxID=3081256 RepID=UPI003017DAED
MPKVAAAAGRAKAQSTPDAIASRISLTEAAALVDAPEIELKRAERWGYIKRGTKGQYSTPSLIAGFCRYLASGEMTVADAALLIGNSAVWAKKLIDAGYIARNTRGNVIRTDVVQGHIRFLRDEERRTSLVQNESGLRAARQREVELRIAERERELVPRDEAEAAMDVVVGKVNAEMNGLAARVTRDIEMRTKIETEVHASLQRISEALEAGSENLASGGADAAADTEDDA